MESIVFHARKSQDEKTPIFTIRFGAEKSFDNGETLFCVVSKPHPGLEAYCKKTGNQITTDRLSCLGSEFKNGRREVISLPVGEKELRDFLPRGTTKSLSFYADRARRFFKLDNPKVVIRGTRLTWEPKEYGAQASKTPVILVTRLS
jgi:hypothetical protein